MPCQNTLFEWLLSVDVDEFLTSWEIPPNPGGVGAGAIFADVSGKNGQGKREKKGKWVKIEKKRRKIAKGKVEN